MVAIKIEGRMGNQLFQYAFIYATAKKLGTSFYIDESIDRFILPKYFDIKKDIVSGLSYSVFSIKGYKNVFQYHLKWKFFKILENLFFSKELIVSNKSNPIIEKEGIANHIMYKGYFQSEVFFSEQKHAILNLFQVKKKYELAFNNVRKMIPQGHKYVTVHIRRGDYTDLSINLPDSYYHEAINEIHDDSNFYILISDDPAYVSSTFSYLKNRYISDNSEIVDFQFLLSADYCIISNSSFSWWGAYLNKKASKIIAPENWLGFNSGQEYPEGVMTSKFDWKKVKL